MHNDLIQEVQKRWAEIGQYKNPSTKELMQEIELYKKMLQIFLVGDFYYFIFNPPQNTIEYVGPTIGKVLGYEPEEFTIELMMSIIHPDDLPTFVSFESSIVEFKKGLSPEELLKYKSRYNYRVRKKDGNYIHILQQSITVQSDLEGAVLRNFVIHTDVTYLKSDNEMKLSFIGLDGAPSYVDVHSKSTLTPVTSTLSKRELEVLVLLASGYNTADIAGKIFLSPHTVSTHRRNIFKKTKTSSIGQLIKLAVEKCWI